MNTNRYTSKHSIIHFLILKNNLGGLLASGANPTFWYKGTKCVFDASS